MPIPPKLTLTGGEDDARYQYRPYEFTASSRTRSGSLRELDPIVERLNEGEDDNDPDLNNNGILNETNVRVVTIRQALARVGNIAAAKAGSIAITPEKAYETYRDSEEKARRFVIKFTAAGPMWNSVVKIIFPAELDALDADQVTHLKEASGSLTPTGNSGYFRLGNTGGAEVSFSDDTGANEGQDDGEGDDATATGDGQTITINVKAMDKGQGFEIIYESKIPSVATNTPVANKSAFTAMVTTGADTNRDEEALLNDPNVVGGLLRHKDGSGTMMVVPMYVEINSGVKQFELRYTAETLLRNADAYDSDSE